MNLVQFGSTKILLIHHIRAGAKSFLETIVLLIHKTNVTLCFLVMRLTFSARWRDYLVSKGFEVLPALTMDELFPQTSHVENHDARCKAQVMLW